MLSNWLAVCMYQHIADTSARPMFLLLKALKQQIEKGPIDAVTHDARYSLSEERLLREQINYNIVILHVLHEEVDSEDKILCRANDCDTISQVKSKILDVLYKNV